MISNSFSRNFLSNFVLNAWLSKFRSGHIKNIGDFVFNLILNTFYVTLSFLCTYNQHSLGLLRIYPIVLSALDHAWYRYFIVLQSYVIFVIILNILDFTILLKYVRMLLVLLNFTEYALIAF